MSVTIELTGEIESQLRREALQRNQRPSDLVVELVAAGLARDGVSLARQTALLAEPTLRKIWDTPEEDEAWRDL